VFGAAYVVRVLQCRHVGVGVVAVQLFCAAVQSGGGGVEVGAAQLFCAAMQPCWELLLQLVPVGGGGDAAGGWVFGVGTSKGHQEL
jgi:hypothetical protein